MTGKTNIKMGVIFYGNNNQLEVNKKQCDFLRLVLTDFSIEIYDFNKQEDNRLKEDFEKGKIDIVLKNSYGRGHENYVEKFLEQNHIPYFGSDSKATLIGTSKYLSKDVFKKNKLPTAPDYFISKDGWLNQLANHLNNIIKDIQLPCIVKDTEGTDSRGIFYCQNIEKLKDGINYVVKLGHDVLIEKFIDNAYEATCFVYQTKEEGLIACAPIGIIKEGAIISGEQKDGLNVKLELPVKLNNDIIKKIKAISIKAHKALNCKDFSRSDLLIKENNIYLLEVDVHPGFRQNNVIDKVFKYENKNLNNLFLKLYEQYRRK